jgi:hypothetical protein
MALGNGLEPEEGDKPPPLPLPSLPFPSLASCLISFPKLMHLKFGLACNLPIEKIHTYFVTKRQRASQENFKKICWARFFHYHSVCIFRKVWNAV